MNTNQQTKGRLFKMYLKKYGYLVLIGVALLTLTITLLVVGTQGPEQVETPPPAEVSGTVKTSLPVLDATIAKEYNDTSLMYNSTLKQWEAHKSIDFQAQEGSSVVAAMDGTVVDVYSNYLKGTVVVLEHDNGLKTVYGSLQEDVNVAVGDRVTCGAEIGKVGATANAEADLGAHLNFQMLENDKKIDPAGYLNIGENK